MRKLTCTLLVLFGVLVLVAGVKVYKSNSELENLLDRLSVRDLPISELPKIHRATSKKETWVIVLLFSGVGTVVTSTMLVSRKV